MILDRAWRRVTAFPGRHWWAAAAFAAVLIFSFWLFPAASRASGSPSNKIQDLQRAHTREAFIQVLRSWSEADSGAIGILKQENLIELDFVFPAVYAVAGSLVYLSLSGRRQPRRRDRLFFAAPIAAALFDYVENALHLTLLSGIDNVTQLDAAIEAGRLAPGAILAAAIAADLKFALLSVSIIGVLAAGVARIRKAWRSGLRTNGHDNTSDSAPRDIGNPEIP